MRLKVKSRNGPGRIGELYIDNYTITSPNILFVNTKRFKAPYFSDFLITNESYKTNKATLKIKKNNYFPKDLSKNLLLSNIEFNKKDNEKYFVIPANKDIINEVLENNTSSFFII